MVSRVGAAGGEAVDGDAGAALVGGTVVAGANVVGGTVVAGANVVGGTVAGANVDGAVDVSADFPARIAIAGCQESAAGDEPGATPYIRPSSLAVTGSGT